SHSCPFPAFGSKRTGASSGNVAIKSSNTALMLRSMRSLCRFKRFLLSTEINAFNRMCRFLPVRDPMPLKYGFTRELLGLSAWHSSGKVPGKAAGQLAAMRAGHPAQSIKTKLFPVDEFGPLRLSCFVEYIGRNARA